MGTRRVVVVLWICLGLITSILRAQGTKADYERAAKLVDTTSWKVAHDQVYPHWTTDGNAFWYRSRGLDGKRDYWWVDAIAGT